MRGRFLTFEGVEGAGKTTQAAMLAEYLRKRGIPVMLVREPGGTEGGEAVRAILLQERLQWTATAELLLFLAARAQLTETVVRPALEVGAWVICDRYADSSVAYQGYGRGLGPEAVRNANRLATGGLKPDVTVLLDLPVRVGLERQDSRNRMEGEPVAFHERVREGYLQEAALEPDRFVVIDAGGSADQVHAEVLQKLMGKGILAPVSEVGQVTLKASP